MSIWTNNGLSHITPKGKENPEGFDVWGWLGQAVGDRSILDYGCGRGRLSKAFNPDRYLGYDINTKAIEAARVANPDHWYCDSPELRDVTLFYTVALHIPDDEVHEVLDTGSETVFIVEIMREDMKRGDGIPPAYNRSPELYSEIMQTLGYKLKSRQDKPYKYYNQADITMLEFVKC